MYINRLIDSHLLNWKKDDHRKPLLLRGARQVGKSSAVKQLAKQFDNFIEINFEENPKFKRIFDGDLSPGTLIETISIVTEKSIEIGSTLIFLDEIQACPNAISSLRFFYEKMPELHIIAAGSLLEFAFMTLPSFGVGRIRSIFVYPFSFDEFLMALNLKSLLDVKNKADVQHPLSKVIHEKLVNLLKTFMLLGGMPEAVATYAVNRKLSSSQNVLDDLYNTLKADFVKYKSSVPVTRLNEIFESVVNQSGKKFIYTKASISANLGQIKEALELLIMAGLVIPVTHTNANGLPLGAEVDPRKRKMLLLDTGIFQRILGLDVSDFILDNENNLVNKGTLAELFWGLEYLKYSPPFTAPSLYYWHREQANANAEVDYVIQKGQDILPIEIKSSTKGGMQSLRQFLRDKNKPTGYRFSLENFSIYQDIHSYPLYAISNFLKL